VLVYPVAGPTPGNTPFASLYDGQFPLIDGLDYNCWNANIVNLLDIVPQAWCDKPTESPLQNIEKILSIWGVPPLGFVMLLVFIMGLLASSSGVTYHPIRSRYFTGAIPTRPTDRNQWIKTARQEHETEYMKYIGVVISSLKHVLRDPRTFFGGVPEDDSKDEDVLWEV
jgi:hypothetical protein